MSDFDATNLRIRNWASFQHYKDRNPPWLKLHRTLLENQDYYELSPDAGKALPLIWIIASEKDGAIPTVENIAWRLRIPSTLAESIVSELIKRDFVEAGQAEQVATQAQVTARTVADANGFGTRHISDAVKHEVWDRDGGKCVYCGSTENIEYDHKTPVSKGGTSEAANIQLLCRKCNRKKRVKVAAPAEQVATGGLDSRSLEAEESRAEEEKSRGEIAPISPKNSTECAIEIQHRFGFFGGNKLTNAIADAIGKVSGDEQVTPEVARDRFAERWEKSVAEGNTQAMAFWIADAKYLKPSTPPLGMTGSQKLLKHMADWEAKHGTGKPTGGVN